VRRFRMIHRPSGTCCEQPIQIMPNQNVSTFGLELSDFIVYFSNQLSSFHPKCGSKFEKLAQARIYLATFQLNVVLHD